MLAMTLAEICKTLAAAPAPVLHGIDVPHPLATETALRMLARMLGLPVAALDLPPPSLAQRFPKDRIPEVARATFGRELRRYRSWRRLVLDAQMLGCGSAVDPDPWDSLRRAARLVLGANKANCLYALGKHFPDTPPHALALEDLVAVQDRLSGMERQAFRRAVAVLTELYDHDLPRATGLLPPRFEMLPQRPRLPELLPLPDRLAGHPLAKDPTVTTAAAYGWTLAVRSGIMDSEADPVDGRALDRTAWRRLAAIDPASYGFALSAESFDIYLGHFARLLVAAGAPDPRVDRTGADWRALMAAVRATGRSANALSTLAARAKRDGVAPGALTAEWIAGQIAATPERARRNAARRGCLLLDALRDDPAIPAELLPAAPTGIARQRGGERASPRPALRAAAPKNPVEQAWIDLLADLRRHGFGADELNCLSAIRGDAIACGLRPRDIDRRWIEARRAGKPRQVAAKIAMAARLLDRVRSTPAMRRHLPRAAIGPLVNRRRSAGTLPAVMEIELRAYLDGLGAAASTRREALAAVRALAEAARRSGRTLPGNLAALLDLARTGLDWGPNRARAGDHAQVIDRLRAHLALPWTADWRALQRAVVAAGVPMRENPVAALLKEAGTRAPQELDADWARAVDRRHRAAGRADLARTFAANLGRLEALHAIPALARSGLLPSHIGPLRPVSSPDGSAAAPG
jgi:hypothetical protein